MAGKAREITLSEKERAKLKSLLQAWKTEQRLLYRIKIILLAGEGMGSLKIAQELGLAPVTVSKWRKRYAEKGIEGLDDARRSGAPFRYDPQSTRERIFKVLEEEPPKGFSRWNAPLIAKRLTDVSVHQIWRITRANGIVLDRKRSWCISNDPDFAKKAKDVVGVYLDPPDGAVVLCVDEKPSIQALERVGGWLKQPNGKSITGANHEYKRHGTTTLFAALDTATGKVTAAHTDRRRRVEFLSFMNQVLREYPDKELHVILDNLSTHKPKVDKWRQRNKNVHFHFTPTHASWMNMVEIWFGILWNQSLAGKSFKSKWEVRRHMDEFIKEYNKTSKPFVWTKKTVRNVHPSKHITDLRK